MSLLIFTQKKNSFISIYGFILDGAGVLQYDDIMVEFTVFISYA